MRLTHVDTRSNVLLLEWSYLGFYGPLWDRIRAAADCQFVFALGPWSARAWVSGCYTCMQVNVEDTDDDQCADIG